MLQCHMEHCAIASIQPVVWLLLPAWVRLVDLAKSLNACMPTAQLKPPCHCCRTRLFALRWVFFSPWIRKHWMSLDVDHHCRPTMQAMHNATVHTWRYSAHLAVQPNTPIPVFHSHRAPLHQSGGSLSSRVSSFALRYIPQWCHRCFHPPKEHLSPISQSGNQKRPQTSTCLTCMPTVGVNRALMLTLMRRLL